MVNAKDVALKAVKILYRFLHIGENEKIELTGTVHRLKTWPEPFEAIVKGQKTCEFRKNDRDFKAFDFLMLEEYQPQTIGAFKKDLGHYTNRKMLCIVTHIIPGGMYGVPEDCVVMSIKTISEAS